MTRRLVLLGLALLLAVPARALDGERQKLADRYLSILRKNPRQSAVVERVWKLFAEAGEAEALGRIAREEAKENPLLAAVLWDRLGESAEARAVLEEAVADGRSEAAALLADQLAAAGDFAGAAKCWEAALAKNPSPAGWTQTGVFWSKAGERTKARTAWERAADLAPEDTGLRLKLGEGAAEAGDWIRAVEHLSVVVERGEPAQRLAAAKEIVRCQENAGHLAAAITAQESVLALMGPRLWERPAAQRRLFDLHRENGTLDELARAVETRAGAPSADPRPAVEAAEFFAWMGDRAAETRWVRVALDRAPTDRGLVRRLAGLEIAAGRSAEAVALYDRLLEADPQDAEAIFLRAEVDALAGREADAEQRIEAWTAAQKDRPAARGRAEAFYRRLRLSGPRERQLLAARQENPGDEKTTLELARFYLDEHRDREAAECLRASGGTDGATARDFAELLRDARLFDEAIFWASRSWEADRTEESRAILAAELVSGRGDPDGALEILDATVADRQALPGEALDRQLFLTVKSLVREKSPDSPLARRLDRLHEAAVAGGPAEALRLARWLRWSGEPGRAAGALGVALERWPDDLALREVRATVLVEAGDAAAALAELRTILQSKPENADEIRRRLGRLELERGNPEEGLRIFSRLAAARPGDWQALTDLAAAEQGASNWFKAFETWRKAYALAPPESRAGVRQPLLNASVRVQLFERGLEFLEAAVVSEADASARQDLLREAAAYAAQNGVAGEWRERLERRVQAQPEDRLWRLGRAYLLEAEGRRSEARAEMARSQRELTETPESLAPLLRAAESAGDWEETARLARRMLALGREPDGALTVQLARALENAGRSGAARDAWISAAAVFARDPAVLTQAAEYFDRTGDENRMESSYRGAARFGACPPQVLLRLGRLALERGDRNQALEDFTQVLERARSTGPVATDRLPLPDVLFDERSAAARPAGPRRLFGAPADWARPNETEVEGCRLAAIREAGRLLRNSPDKAAWASEFSDPLEKIGALHATGQTAEAVVAIRRLSPEREHRQAMDQMLAALLLEANDAATLLDWASEDPAWTDPRWDAAAAAAERLLEAGWKPPGLEVFAVAPPMKRWRFAAALAARQNYREACAVAEGLPDALPAVVAEGAAPAGSASLEIARWRLARRDVDGAVQALDDALRTLPPTPGFAEPFVAVARARWLLTPRDLRADFVEKLLATLRDGGQSDTALAVTALLAAQDGRDDEARDAIVQLAASANQRFGAAWADTLTLHGAQLEEWRLSRLARDLYRAGADYDVTAAVAGVDFRRQRERLLAANQLQFASSESIPYLVREWSARGATAEDLLRAAERLRQRGLEDRAAVVLTELAAGDPRDESTKAGLLGFVDDSRTRAVVRAYVLRLLSEGAQEPGQILVQNTALRLAAADEQSGHLEDCLEVLDRLREAGVVHRAFSQQRARVLAALGRHEAALAELESQARVLPVPGPGLAVPLAELYLGWGRADEARAVLQKEIQTGSVDRHAAARALREWFPAGDALGDPAEELARFDRTITDKGERFAAGREFLQTEKNLPAAVVERELGRLGRLARHRPALAPSWYALRREVADREGTTARLERELAEEWARGETLAGEHLVLLAVQNKRPEQRDRLLGELLQDRHYDEAFWDELGQVLLSEGQAEPAVRVWEELSRRSQGGPTRTLRHAEALWKSGRTDEARTLVGPIERIAALDPGRRIDLAQFFLATGQPVEARRSLEALGDRPMDRGMAALWAGTARAFVAAGDRPAAEAAMARALTVPAAVDPAILAEIAAGAAEPGVYPAGPLPAVLRTPYAVAMARRFLENDDLAGALAWLRAAPDVVRDGPGRHVLGLVEKSAPDAAGEFWAQAEAPATPWKIRCEAADYFVRLARQESDPEKQSAAFTRALGLQPGNFAAADGLATAALRRGQRDEAEAILRRLLKQFCTPDDRRAAERRLEEISAALPPGGKVL